MPAEGYEFEVHALQNCRFKELVLFLRLINLSKVKNCDVFSGYLIFCIPTRSTLQHPISYIYAISWHKHSHSYSLSIRMRLYNYHCSRLVFCCLFLRPRAVGTVGANKHYSHGKLCEKLHVINVRKSVHLVNR